MSTSSDLIAVHRSQGSVGVEPKDRPRRGCLELIDAWLWVDEIPEVSFDSLIMTSIDSGSAGVILFTDQRIIICHYDPISGDLWQQTGPRIKAEKLQRRRKPVASNWTVYDAGFALPGSSNAVGVLTSDSGEFEAALIKGPGE